MWRGMAVGTGLALVVVSVVSGQGQRSRDMQVAHARPAYQPQPTSDGADYNGWEHYDPAKPVTLKGRVVSAAFSRGEDDTQALLVITVSENPPDHIGWRVVLDTIPALQAAGLASSQLAT